MSTIVNHTSRTTTTPAKTKELTNIPQTIVTSKNIGTI
jgi:hypothetical protein